MKTIVIGLDGAGFELIDPWIEQGILPNIARIKREGVWGDMESVLPPVTSPNWKCFSTGKNPGKIGIFWWENIDWDNRRVYYPAARNVRNKEIWDYLGGAGMKVGIIGMPTTCPPKEVKGFLIAGGEAGDNNFAHPAELEEELRRQGWRNRPQFGISIDREKACQEIHEIIDRHFEMANILGRRYEVDFLMVAVFNINTLHHSLWDAPETKKGWEIIDKHVGKFMDHGCDLVIMSDHGSNKIESVFNINTWLREEGYLKLNTNLSALLYRLGINKQSLARFEPRWGKRRPLRKIIPKSLMKNIPTETGEIRREAKTSKINWQKSKALASGQGPIYLNPKNSNNEALKNDIRQKLQALIDPSNGNRIIQKVYSKEEIYRGEYLPEAPDLIMDQAKGIHIPGGIGQQTIFDVPRRWRAENKRFGIFMAYGPDIKQTGKIENVSILDLAPTILHLLGLGIPSDMDGRVLKEIFREESEPAQREVKRHGVDVDREKIRDRIIKLRESGKL
jgi:predicted AlkP superfamily phosphohydrolase/phosphomutase